MIKVKTLKLIINIKCCFSFHYVFLQSLERVKEKQNWVGCACVWFVNSADVLSHDAGAGGCSRCYNRGVSGSPAEP